MNFCLLNHFCLKVSAILKYNLRRAIFPKKIPYCASLCDVLLCQSINLHLHQICGHGACSVACQNTKCTMTKFFSSDLRGPKLKCRLDTSEPQATRGASLLTEFPTKCIFGDTEPISLHGYQKTRHFVKESFPL